MRNIWKTLLIGACLLSFVLLLGVFNASKPRILVLHSAGQQSRWAQEVDRGMREALKANRRPLTIDWLYMDVAAPGVADRVGQAQAEARRAIAREDPAILIAVDDEANLMVAREYVGRKAPRILYVSVDRPPADYGYAGAANVSGIAEKLAFGAIRDAITTMFPGRRTTASIIGVDSVTGRAEMTQAQATDWGPVQIQSAQLVSTAETWRTFVTGSQSDVLVVLSCQNLPDDGGVFTAADASRWTQEHAKALPIGTSLDFVVDGGALSFAPPADDYGQKAIALALDWLDDRSSPGPPPPVESAHFDVAIRQEAIARRGISLPQIYIEAARGNGSLFN